jgi:REP element-mobilizing transposase RayT
MHQKFQNKYRGKSTRLQSWDYSSEGSYFITICTKNSQHFFGKVKDGKMILSEIGRVVEEEWIKSIGMRPEMEIELGEFVVMPNHFHGIIKIVCGARRTAMRRGRTENQFGSQSNNIASIIRGFKSAVTCWCKKNGYSNFAWQPLFHDRIIRDEKAYMNISNYIRNNPENWEKDCFQKNN